MAMKKVTKFTMFIYMPKSQLQFGCYRAIKTGKKLSKIDFQIVEDASV